MTPAHEEASTTVSEGDDHLNGEGEGSWMELTARGVGPEVPRGRAQVVGLCSRQGAECATGPVCRLRFYGGGGHGEVRDCGTGREADGFLQ